MLGGPTALGGSAGFIPQPAMRDMPLAIRTNALTRRFGSDPVVDALDLEVPEGTLFGFLGPNGAGKTTTIRLLLGVLEPTSGHAEVLGHDVAHEGEEIRRQTGVVLDHSGLYLSLTARENMEFFADIWDIPRGVATRREQELLERFGLWERRDDRVGEFSRGMRQKVAVARALLPQPRLLFLDEPTSGLDPQATESFREQLVSLARDNRTTVFLTTHDLAEAEEVCDLVGVIRSGRLLAVGAPTALGGDRSGVVNIRIAGYGFTETLVASIARRRDVLSVDLGAGEMVVRLRAPEDAPAVVEGVVQAGGRVRGVREEQASLRDAFLGLMEDSA